MTVHSDLSTGQWLHSIWAALGRIETNLALPPAPLELPAPIVRVDAPDLTDIVTAVTSLNGTGPTAEEIARAIADVIAPPVAASPGAAETLGEVARALEKLDFRMQGMGRQAYGGGSVSLLPNQTVGISGDVGIAGSVEITNDLGNPIPVRQSGATTATVTRVAASITAVTLLATDMNRAQAIIYNETTAKLYVKLGTGASVTDYTLPVAGGGGYYEVPIRYLGPVSGIWDAATGFAQITGF